MFLTEVDGMFRTDSASEWLRTRTDDFLSVWLVICHITPPIRPWATGFCRNKPVRPLL